MKELTRIITLEITHIECIPDEEEHLIEESKSPERIRKIEEEVKDILNVDDFKIIKVQDFILDK